MALSKAHFRLISFFANLSDGVECDGGSNSIIDQAAFNDFCYAV